MTFVVDASIVVAWAFDEVNAAASGARERKEQSNDESVDPGRDAVFGQCISDRAPLAHEMGALA